MTDTLVLKNTKFTKGLVMPKKGTYLELDQDEMEYVDGGWYLDRSFCDGVAKFANFGQLAGSLPFAWGVAKIAVVLKSFSKILTFAKMIYAISGSKLVATVGAISRMGAIVVGVCAILASSYIVSFFANCLSASAAGTGVELSLGWFQFNAKFC